MLCSSICLFGFNVCNIEVTDDDEALECDEWGPQGTSQLVTWSTRHIVKSCDELTVVFHGVVTS